MGDHNIIPIFDQCQIIDEKICEMCQGSHGNNTLCQANFNSWSE